ncbi:unnamed protein product [Xylocopa violacea]|uniref:RNase NYN domain-containing protein n=1 Tax=Xylocopa violacea TaxID=135666 RepID=A0ABP1P4C9_XYLVO
MSGLNDSVMICGPTPKRKKKAPLKARKTQTKTTYYECPLKFIQQSKRWEQARAQERLVRNAKNVSKNKRNNFFSPEKNDVMQDSVIVLSDNEGESNEKDENKPKQEGTSRKKPLEITLDEKKSIQRLLTSGKTLRGSRTEIESPPRKKLKSIAALSENNSSCLLISDTEDDIEIATINLDGENKAPVSDSINQRSDDIVVVWSSTNSLSSTQSESKEVADQEKNDKIFMIDCNPNLNNLSILDCNEEDTNKQSKEKTGKDDVEKEEEKEMDNCGLPFSKCGLKLPRPHNISKYIIMKKPSTRVNRPRYLKIKRLLSQFSLSDTSTVPPKPSTSRMPTVPTKFAVCTKSPAICRFETGSKPYRPESPTPTSPEEESSDSDSDSEDLPEESESYNSYTPGLYGVQAFNPDLFTAGSSIPQTPNKLREIVIDGNNVAMAHTNGKIFSEEGLKLVIDYFKHRGHSVKAFVPQYRRSLNHPMLERLYRDGTVVFTPSRIVGGKRITPYDDRFILEYATMCGGIVVSLDNYRDLYEEKPEWRDTIKNRILAPTFVGNYVMFPEDPLGRNGPKLKQFLRY